MRFSFLGSGSRGNSLLIEAGKTRVMVDCGFSLKETEKRLQQLGVDAASLDAILVTHEHHDHVAGVGVANRKFKMPVWMTAGSWQAAKVGEVSGLELFNSHEKFSIGDLEVNPFPVPHDAREPSQFTFSDGRHTIGLLTDVGMSTPHIEQQLSGCDALLLECNHDSELLANGSYPPSLKSRVAGKMGHLNNQQSCALLEKIDTSKLQHLVAAHLSEKHNTPQIVTDCLSQAMGCEKEWIAIADQNLGLAWRELR